MNAIATNYPRRKLEEYREAVAFIESFSTTSLRNNFGVDKKDPSFYLERTKAFLKLLGNPEKEFKYIHITGTAGKGSVSTAVHSILTLAGKKAGLYTSPYTTTTIEKIKVGNLYIAPDVFVEVVEYLKPFIEKAKKNSTYGAPAAFELFLTIALLYFKREKCEWVVLEAGLGGRYDATNVIKKPIVTVITNIDYDHTEILGKTLQKIAYDKAGIIKKGSAFYTSEQHPRLLVLFKKICKEQGATYHHIPKKSSYKEYNRELSVRIAETIGISESAVAAESRDNVVPCRFEVMQQKPFIVLDGAHNRAKIQTTIDNTKHFVPKWKKVIVVVSIANTNKDTTAIVKPLAALADVIIVTALEKSERKSVHPNVLLKEFKKYKRKNTSISVIENPHEALAVARKQATKEDCILVTGSFFLAGELRKEWYPEEWILKNRVSI